MTTPKPGSWLPPGVPDWVQERPEVAPPKPTPDGFIRVTSQSGVPHEYPYRDIPKGWRTNPLYLAISTPRGWMRWPWGSIFNWEVVNNSHEYAAAKAKWMEWERAQKAVELDGDADGS